MTMRSGISRTILTDGAPAHAQPGPQPGGPVRRVLVVEQDVAAIVVTGSRRSRPATAMHDGGVGREAHPAAARAEGGAEIDVLFVEEEALIEKARRLRGGPANEQAGAAHPVDLALLGQMLLRTSARPGRRAACQTAAEELRRFGCGRQHPAKRHLGPSRLVHEA